MYACLNLEMRWLGSDSPYVDIAKEAVDRQIEIFVDVRQH